MVKTRKFSRKSAISWRKFPGLSFPVSWFSTRKCATLIPTHQKKTKTKTKTKRLPLCSTTVFDNFFEGSLRVQSLIRSSWSSWIICEVTDVELVDLDVKALGSEKLREKSRNHDF